MPFTNDIRTLPTWLEIDLDALLHNIAHIRRGLAGNPLFMLTVKADAYGHGAVQVAMAAEPVVDQFGVATVDEAVELADAGIRRKILILSPVLLPEVPVAVDHDFALTISSLAFAGEVSRCAVTMGRTIDVHVEIDTGMGRTGFRAEEVADIARHVVELPGIRLAGCHTHFPSADMDAAFTAHQVRVFLDAVAMLEAAGIDVPLLHAANSAASLSLPESHLHMVRPGLAVYGCDPGGADASGLRPVMTWKSRLAQVRRLPAGSSVSYARTFVTERETVLGVLPVGYGHGYPFRLSNRGEVLLAGCRVPVVGRVTMDMTMIDMTGIDPLPQPGDEVVLIGVQGAEQITASEIAERAGTISYEITTGVGKRVARLYRRDGRIIALKTLLGTRSAD